MIRYLLIFLLLLLTIPANAVILFEDNFNGHSDWSPTQYQYSQQTVCKPDGTGTCAGMPSTWDAFRISGWYVSGGNNTLSLGSANARGGSGKAMTVWIEGAGSGWTSDSLFTKMLDTPQTEIYVAFWAKFQSDWAFEAEPDDATTKLFRVAHLAASDYDEYPTMFYVHEPMGVLHLQKRDGTGPLTMVSSLRNTPDYYFDYSPHNNDTRYQVWGSSPTSGWQPSDLGDGDWHHFEFRYKLNSSPGTRDGIWTVWYDGEQKLNFTDLAWIESGGDMNRAWNQVTIGGNSHNHFGNAEQWYAYDDVVVSTTYIGTEYVIGGAIPDTTPPTIDSIDSDKPNGTYGVAEIIDIDVNFAESVTSAEVTVNLNTGRSCTFAITASSSGTCNYTVQAGDSSADLTTTSISGTITDQSDNAMVDFVPATNLAANKAIIIDTSGDNTAPTPNPMTFSVAPIGSSASTITMTATTASDPSAPIQYLFTYTDDECGTTTNLGSPEQPANKDGQTYHGSSYIYDEPSADRGYITRIEIYVHDFHLGVLDFGVFTNTGGLNFIDSESVLGLVIADGLNIFTHDDTDFDAADLPIATGQYIGFYLTSDGEVDRQISGDPGPGYWYAGSDQISDIPASGVFIYGQQYELQVRVFIEDKVPAIPIGGTSSSWQESTVYEDAGLEAGKCYGYTVSAKDSVGNITSESEVATALIKGIDLGEGMSMSKMSELVIE